MNLWIVGGVNSMNKEWDIFISHASEDKAEIVEPLAKLLQSWGVRVWYDEFELKLGDSLSRKIDYGLIQSNFGLVVLSKSFFEKQWTEYELRSLLSRVVSGEPVVLPLWYDIEKEDVQKYSLYLSDIKALSTNIGIEKLALEIVNRVRPDILNSYLRIQMSRKIEKESIKKTVPLKELHDSPIKHKSLPAILVISCRLIEEVFSDILHTTYEEMVVNFAKDWDYEREFFVWSAIANTYMQFIKEKHCDFGNLPKKIEMFSLLLHYSLTGVFDVDIEKYKLLNGDEQIHLIRCYINNCEHINKMVKNMDYDKK